MSSLDIDGILVNTKELDRLRKEQEVVVLEINKMHKKLLATPKVVEKPGDNSLSKLKHLYTQAKQLSEDEVSVSTALLGQLETLLPAGPPGQPRRKIEKPKRMKADSDNARLSPAMRNLETCANMKDEQVAARVTPDGAEKDEWFIVKVIHFDKETKLFEVLDEEPGDEDEGGGQRKYKLPMSAIISFPKRNDPSTVPEFLPGRRVLAVYPGTTALYRATVVNGHRKRKTDEKLELASSVYNYLICCALQIHSYVLFWTATCWNSTMTRKTGHRHCPKEQYPSIKWWPCLKDFASKLPVSIL